MTVLVSWVVNPNKAKRLNVMNRRFMLLFFFVYEGKAVFVAYQNEGPQIARGGIVAPVGVVLPLDYEVSIN